MKEKILAGFLLILGIASSACSVAAQNSDPQPRKEDESIIGRWHLDGQLPPGNSGHSFHWFLEYAFNDDGTFMLTGYPPLMQKGKYRIVKSEENKFTVDLYEQSGNFGTKDKQIEIIFNGDKGTLTIDGKEGFEKVKGN